MVSWAVTEPNLAAEAVGAVPRPLWLNKAAVRKHLCIRTGERALARPERRLLGKLGPYSLENDGPDRP